MKRLHILATALALAAAVPSLAAERPAPRILVNIVVSSMRANDLDRYADNFSQSGFLRLRDQGRRFTEAEYDYMQTTTPVSLATIVTGAMPSTHGVVAAQWYDYVTNKQVGLIDDAECQSVNFSGGSGGYSPRNLVAQTLSDALARQDESSRIATVAIEPLSAIVTAGHSGEVYWMETLQTAWTTSSYYTKTLPAWIADYNRNQTNLGYLLEKWTPLLQYDTYHNSQVLDIEGLKSHNNKRIEFIGDESSSALPVDEYNLMCYTPAGNSALLAFARHIITNDEMGRDEHPDILNVVLDTPRKISERFGPESVEYEDMLYRLDRDIEEFISFLLTQVEDPSQVVVTLTSDHGTSPSFDSPAEQQERFNVRQAEVITNAFIGAQHGNGEWILGYIDRAFYLNHNLIYEKGLSIADMQHDVATFLMQLRGVSHAVSAEALRSTYFGSGYGRKVQNGFYPRRSGDVVVNLMPDWIEERDSVRSMSGSMYRYDTHVPLVIFGGGITAGAVDTPVDMISLAPTLARMLHIDAPSAAEGTALEL